MKRFLLLVLLLSNTAFASGFFGGGGGGGAIDGPVAGGLDNAILFVDPAGTLAQDETKFSYDKSSTRFCLGCASPAETFHLVGSARFASLGLGLAHLSATGVFSSSLLVDADVSASAAIAYSKLALSDSIVNADINSAAAIVDTKLDTISTSGKVSNSATTATDANTNSAIVARDGSGNFSAGTITAALTGNVTGDLNGNVTGNVTGTLTGNASTASALAADPTDCAAGQKATSIAASGNLTCSSVSLTADVANTLPIGNGGTGQATQTAAFDALDPLTSKGDIVIHDGTNSVRQAAGTNGFVLAYDSAQTTGVVAVGNGALTVSGSRASPNNITAAGGITGGSTPRQLIFIQGNAAAIDISANPQISAGTVVGQEIVLDCRSDSNTVLLEDGTGLDLNGSYLCGAGQGMYLIWDGTNWVEVSRR